jgi:hypothetical protein
MSSSTCPAVTSWAQNLLDGPRIIRTVVTSPTGRTGRSSSGRRARRAHLPLPSSDDRSRPSSSTRHGRSAAARRRAHVCITEGDILRHAPPRTPHTLVSNVPFHITTARCSDGCCPCCVGDRDPHHAVGGRPQARAASRATQLTAQWWPWYDFELRQHRPRRVLAQASVTRALVIRRRRSTPRWRHAYSVVRRGSRPRTRLATPDPQRHTSSGSTWSRAALLQALPRPHGSMAASSGWPPRWSRRLRRAGAPRGANPRRSAAQARRRRRRRPAGAARRARAASSRPVGVEEAQRGTRQRDRPQRRVLHLTSRPCERVCSHAYTSSMLRTLPAGMPRPSSGPAGRRRPTRRRRPRPARPPRPAWHPLRVAVEPVPRRGPGRSRHRTCATVPSLPSAICTAPSRHRKQPVRGDRRVVVALGAADLARDRPPGALERRARHQGRQQRGAHHLAAAGAVALVQRRQHPVGAVHARQQVTDGDADLLRLVRRRAGQRHDARLAPGRSGRSRRDRPRPVVAEAADRQHDEPRVALQQRRAPARAAPARPVRKFSTSTSATSTSASSTCRRRRP